MSPEKFKGRVHNEVVGSKGCYGFDLSKFNNSVDKRLLLRNLVEPELGKHVLDCALKQKQTKLIFKLKKFK